SQNNNADTDNVAILLVIGAVLVVIGAVVLALALWRVRRTPIAETPTSLNFYQTLDTVENTTQNSDQNDLLSDDSDEPITKLHVDDDLDNLLVTQVLGDERFQNMMAQSRSNMDIVGWIRLLSREN